MQISKVLRYYGGLVKRKIKRMSRKRKQIIVVGASCLVLGLVFGNIFGGIRQKKQAEKQIKKVTAQVQKEEQKKTKAVQKELEQLQQKQAEQEEELPWNMVLVNSSHPMTEGYVPELTEVADGYSVDSRIAEPLNNMLKAAEADGMNIITVSYTHLDVYKRQHTRRLDYA